MQHRPPDSDAAVRSISPQAGLTMLHGLPSGYNRDFHEEKELLFQSCDMANRAAAIIPGLVSTTNFNLPRMKVLSHPTPSYPVPSSHEGAIPSRPSSHPTQPHPYGIASPTSLATPSSGRVSPAAPPLVGTATNSMPHPPLRAGTLRQELYDGDRACKLPRVRPPGPLPCHAPHCRFTGWGVDTRGR